MIKARKLNHLQISLQDDILTKMSNGFEKYSFEYDALPEINFDDIDTSVEFLGKQLSIPLMISSLTGGIKDAININETLARFAEDYSLAMCVGSERILLSNEELVTNGFNLRRIAPNILLFANMGAVQLNYGCTTDDYKKVVDLIEADALMLHINPLQEVFQNAGNTDFSGLLSKIETLCKELHVPVIAKEVGFGLSRKTAEALVNAGVKGIDVAGRGGTDWIKIESIASNNKIIQDVANDFHSIGIRTADAITAIRDLNTLKIASGGINTGVDIAKAIALGANITGIARGFLKNLMNLDEYYLKLLKSLQIAMFSIGAVSIQALYKTDKIHPIS